jgi:DNA-binding PadR family transcriptional regulator
MELEQIHTIKPGGGKGMRLRASAYLKLARAILRYLSSNEEITILDLLAKVEAENKKTGKDNGSFVYAALHVKLDLEGRGYLKLERSRSNPGQIQRCIRITRRGRKYLESID